MPVVLPPQDPPAKEKKRDNNENHSEASLISKENHYNHIGNPAANKDNNDTLETASTEIVDQQGVLREDWRRPTTAAPAATADDAGEGAGPAEKSGT